MRARVSALVALAAATLASVAAAGPDAAKQRVAINMKIYPQRTFVLTPLQSGTLKRDSGTMNGDWASSPGRKVMRDGQTITIYNGAVTTLAGQRGSLTIRDRLEWIDVSNENTRYGYPPGIGIGTWKVVRGSGQYAGVRGEGRLGHAGLGSSWFARYEGFLIVP